MSGIYNPGSSGGSGAPTTADYLVKTADAGLSAERVVTDTSSITWDWGTAGQAKAVAASRLYAQDSNGVTYNTDNAERSVFSFTLTGGDLTANGRLRVVLMGNLLINSGSCTLTPRVKLGSTTMWGDVSPTLTNSATRKAFFWEAILANLAATNAQSCVGRIYVAGNSAGSVAGLGDLAAFTTATLAGAVFRGTAAEDTTGNLTVDFTTTLSVSNSADEVVIDHAFAELLK